MCCYPEIIWNLAGVVFKQLLLGLEAKFVPLKRLSDNGRDKKAAWMTHEALRYVRHKRKVFRKYKDSEHPAVKRANITAKKQLKKSEI